jgi:hypothetical protein
MAAKCFPFIVVKSIRISADHFALGARAQAPQYQLVHGGRSLARRSGEDARFWRLGRHRLPWAVGTATKGIAYL